MIFSFGGTWPAKTNNIVQFFGGNLGVKTCEGFLYFVANARVRVY